MDGRVPGILILEKSYENHRHHASSARYGCEPPSAPRRQVARYCLRRQHVAATPIELEHNPIFYALRKEKFHTSILTMELDGKDQLVVLRAFQMHPYKPQVMHIDFQRVNADEPVTMSVPLHFFGAENSPAVKISKGLINHARSSIEVSCLPKDLPEFISVDLSGLTAQTTMRVSDIALPEGVSAVVHGNEDPVVVSVVAQVEEEDTTADAAAADAAAPAAAPAASEAK